MFELSGDDAGIDVIHHDQARLLFWTTQLAFLARVRSAQRDIKRVRTEGGATDADDDHVVDTGARGGGKFHNGAGGATVFGQVREADLARGHATKEGAD